MFRTCPRPSGSLSLLRPDRPVDRRPWAASPNPSVSTGDSTDDRGVQMKRRAPDVSLSRADSTRQSGTILEEEYGYDEVVGRIAHNDQPSPTVEIRVRTQDTGRFWSQECSPDRSRQAHEG
ncbi:hypothetical protein C9J85_06835 [Haloferax sp. wsp5]|nr:hypothetical protein C9J85_06835 [Haloferax sp. wsp5]